MAASVVLRFMVVFLVAFASFAATTTASANSKYAAIVMHADSGDVLFARYADETRYPASLTKMMTLYMLFEELEAGRVKLDDKLKVSATAAGQPPSKLGVASGGTIDVETAIRALVVKSANDVAVVVAERISGSEWRFAQAMTEKARALGMRRTTFRNASGLPNRRQVTTARDLATLSRRVVQDFPQYYHFFADTRFSWGGKTYSTHNRLVRDYEGADGLKTGYTRRSGFNLATSAVRNDQRLIGVVLGGRSSSTRDAHMRKILTEGFGAITAKPTLIASLHRNTPSPRLKPTLLAELEARNGAPTLANNQAMRDEIALAAAGFGPAEAANYDQIGALIAAADITDLNEFQRARISALSIHEGVIGEGDAETNGAMAGAWHAQIGAYSTKSLAQAELEKAVSVGAFEQLPRMVAPFTSAEGKTLYRARFTMLAEREARTVCEKLAQASLACLAAKDEPAAR